MDPYHIARLLSEDIRINNGFLYEDIDDVTETIKRLYEEKKCIYEIEREFKKKKIKIDPYEIANQIKSIMMGEERAKQPRSGSTSSNDDRLRKRVDDRLLRREFTRLAAIRWNIANTTWSVPDSSFKTFMEEQAKRGQPVDDSDAEILMKSYDLSILGHVGRKDYTNTYMRQKRYVLEQEIREMVNNGDRVTKIKYARMSNWYDIVTRSNYSLGVPLYRIRSQEFDAIRLGVFTRVDFGDYITYNPNTEMEEFTMDNDDRIKKMFEDNAREKVNRFEFDYEPDGSNNKYKHIAELVDTRTNRQVEGAALGESWDPSKREKSIEVNPILRTPQIVFTYAEWLGEKHNKINSGNTKAVSGYPPKPFEYLYNAITKQSKTENSGDLFQLFQDEEKDNLIYALSRIANEYGAKKIKENPFSTMLLSIFSDIQVPRCINCGRDLGTDEYKKCFRCVGGELPSAGDTRQSREGSIYRIKAFNASSNRRFSNQVTQRTGGVRAAAARMASVFTGTVVRVNENLKDLVLQVELVGDFEIPHSNKDETIEKKDESIEEKYEHLRSYLPGATLRFDSGEQQDNHYTIKNVAIQFNALNESIIILTLQEKEWRLGTNDTTEAKSAITGTAPNEGDEIRIWQN